MGARHVAEMRPGLSETCKGITGPIPARDHAFFIDQLFVRVLGCDDEGLRA